MLRDLDLAEASAAPAAPAVTDDTVAVWNAFYTAGGLTDWELLPPKDLSAAVALVLSRGARLRSAAEIGCGRGMRSLVAILNNPTLNDATFSLVGIDHSSAAVYAAGGLAFAAARGAPLPEPFGALVDTAVAIRPRPLLCADLRFEHADLFNWLSGHSERAFDLIVDWMCFHEVPPNMRGRYADLVARCCGQYFIVNTFSKEGSSVDDLGVVADGIIKYQLSQEDISDIFGEYFDIVEYYDVPEDLLPEVAPRDGIVAAKRTYILKRL